MKGIDWKFLIGWGLMIVFCVAMWTFAVIGVVSVSEGETACVGSPIQK